MNSVLYYNGNELERYCFNNEQNYQRYIKFAEIIKVYRGQENRGQDLSGRFWALASLSGIATFILLLAWGAGKVFHQPIAPDFKLIMPLCMTGALFIGSSILSCHFERLATAKKIKICALYSFAKEQTNEAELKALLEKLAIEPVSATLLTEGEKVQVQNALNGVEGICSQAMEAPNCPCIPPCLPLVKTLA